MSSAFPVRPRLRLGQPGCQVLTLQRVARGSPALPRAPLPQPVLPSSASSLTKSLPRSDLGHTDFLATKGQGFVWLVTAEGRVPRRISTGL